MVGIGAGLTPESKPGRLFDRWLRGEFDLVPSANIIADVERALRTKRTFGTLRSAAERTATVDGLRRLAQVVDPVVVPGITPHRHDDPVLAAVAASQADWFVTGDEALLAMRSYAGVPFATPVAFLAALDGVEDGG